MNKSIMVLCVASFVILIASFEAFAYPDGLVSYWQFDEESGSTAIDSVGNNHGTIDGASWENGFVSGALSFDGINDIVRQTSEY